MQRAMTICVLLLVAMVSALDFSPYLPLVQNITQTILQGEMQGKTWASVADLTDTFGSRRICSPQLEQSIDWLYNKAIADGFENVRKEQTGNCTNWVRGFESLEMLAPRHAKMQVTAFGRSIATPEQGIEANILVVETFAELDQQQDNIKGKIVIINPKYDIFANYGAAARFRRDAPKAAKYGAVAVLVKSLTEFSIGTVHTGATAYDVHIPQIPAGAITVEDAEMLTRMYKRRQQVKLRLKFGCSMQPACRTYNVIAERVGTTFPNEIVLVAGHIDSWDLSPGAMDDSAAVMMAYYAIKTMIHLNIRPKRTIRLVAFSGEELDMCGATSFMNSHFSELHNIIAAFESDYGAFTPFGIGIKGGPNGKAMLQDLVTQLLAPTLNVTTVQETTDTGADIGILYGKNHNPQFTNLNRYERYFYYHHAPGDYITVYRPIELDLNAAMIASFAYVVADMQNRFPTN